MQSRRIDRLTAFAASYPELRETLAIELSPAREELLKRASVAPSFDEQIYKEFCEGVDAPLTFAEFTGISEIERVPYSGGRYWVRDSVRPEYLRKWPPDEMREWSRRLAPFFHSPTDQLKLLELRILFDPAAALSQFEKLYKQADDRFDLAQCYALLGALRSRESALDVELYKALSDYFTLYSARAKFTEEYHQTVDYFQRTGASVAFRNVLREKGGKWILNVHGGGGMGKTMLLRWLIAHRLVRRKMRIPCVRLDLDAFSLAAVTDSPWLLALPIAEQLQDQVVASTFATIARDLASYRRLLLTGEVSMTTIASFALAASAGDVDYLPALQDAFRHMPQDRPVVLFLDTIEEATLHRPEKVMEVLDFFSLLRQSAPHLRLVVAGRYQLGKEHLPEFASRYGAFTDALEVKRLEDGESRTFFLQQAPAAETDLVDAVVSRADGNPFKIALLAELIRDDSEIDRDRLLSKEFEDIEIAYLIQRVVSRIPEKSQLPLRWVVRYGAIARRLTPDFIGNVLLPPLQRALRGEAQELGDDMVDDAISRNVWKAESNFTVDSASIWSQLSQYASSHGWISIDKSDPNVARFHPDVVAPMRRLLSRQKIYTRLHSEAVSYFRERGATTDALYHQLQLCPSEVVSDWSAELNAAAARMHPSQWRAFAESLLEKDFIEADASAKALAHWHAAEATAFETGCGSYILPSAEFDTAQSHLRAAQQMQGEQRLIPESVWTCLAAASKFRVDRDGALADILREVEKPHSHADRARFLLHAGAMEAQLGASGERRLLEAFWLLPPIPSKRYVLHERIAELLDSRGGWMLARSHYDEALSIAVELGFRSSIEQLRRRIIRLDLATGRISEALRTLLEAEGIAPGQEPQDPEWFDLHAEVALSSLRPATAIDFASSLLQTAQGPSAAQACLYRAKAYRLQRQLSRAISEYQRAAAGFNEAGDLAGIDECLTGELMLHVLYSGDAMEAERLLSRPVHTASTNSLRRSIFESARAFVAARKGRALDARSILMRAIGAATSPQESAMLHITGLSLRIWDDPGPPISQLICAAADIQPASARLSLLDNLAISPAWGSIAKEDRARLDEIFVYEPQDDIERAVHALLKADLLRVTGEVDRALNLLAEAIPSVGQRSVESFHYVERLQVESRIRSDGRRVPAEYNAALLEAFNKDGLIAAIIRMDLADAFMDRGENAIAGEVLTGVDSLIRDEPIDKMQRARYDELLERLRLPTGIIQSTFSAISESEMPIPFGVQAETGQYLPPLQESDLDHIERGSPFAQTRAASAGALHLAAIADISPDNLDEAGWGVIFASATPAAQKHAVKEALKPLFDLRACQAGDLFKVFDDATGYRQGITADQWLTARGSALNVVDPSQGVPYYLLIVGSPAEIPFEFQHDLDTCFAVGRLSFDSPQEYAEYAQNMVIFEKMGAQQKKIAIFNTRNEGDRATAVLHDQVAKKLAMGDDKLKPLGAQQGYSVTTLLADAATKSELLNLLCGQSEAGMPAILFTGSHSVLFSMDDPQQRLRQGAILTQDWAGPGASISPNTYLTAAEIPSEAALNGLLHFFFASYSAGCPKFDTYTYGPGNQPVQIAKDTIVSRLPQKLLLQGAQAVIGRIDRAWAYSFQTNTGQAIVQSFRDPLARLLQGRRIGDALGVFDQRWSLLSAALLTLVQNREVKPNAVRDSVLANRWMARDDARNYIVLGDPAARLKIANSDAQQPRPPAHPISIQSAVVPRAPSTAPPIVPPPAVPEREDDDPENLKCTLFVISAPPDSNQFMTFEPPSFFKPVGLNQSPILPMLYEAAQQRIPTKLYGALAGNWIGATEQMTALFHTRERSVDNPVRLLLDTSGNLAGIPWEFSPIFRGPRPMFRAPIRSQVLTATGEVGYGLSSVWKTVIRGLRAVSGNRDLTSARDALRAAPRVGPPRVMVLNFGQERRRSEAGFAYTKVPDIYGNSEITLAGFDSEVNADSIEHRISEAQPEVIVIFSEMIDSPSIPEPMLATGRLLPRMLSHIAGRARKDTPGPTIILDVPLPASPEHAIQQLHARNRFASELQRAGNVTAVIATGLGPDDDVLNIHSLLVSLMLESASLDETLDSVREHYKDSSELRDALPYLGFAVLSNYPYQLLVPRAKQSNA